MSARKENRDRKRIIEEGRKITDWQRQVEAFTMKRSPRIEPPSPPRSARRRDVRRWMQHNSGEFENATCLAEAANAAFRIDGDPLGDETHWIWDEALEAFESA